MTDKDITLGALLLSALMQTSDGDLAKLRRQRLGRGSKVDLAHLLRAREILLKLHEAIQADTEEGWKTVHAAWKVFHETRQDDKRVVDEQGVVQGQQPEKSPTLPFTSEEPPKEAVEPPKEAVEPPKEAVEPPTVEPPKEAVEPPKEAVEPPKEAPAPVPYIPGEAPAAVPTEPARVGPKASPWVQRGFTGSGTPASAGGQPKPPPSSVDPVAPTRPGGSPYPQPPAPVPLAGGGGKQPAIPTGAMPVTPAVTTLPFAGKVAPPPAAVVVGEKQFTGTLDGPQQVDSSPLPFAGGVGADAAAGGVGTMTVASYAALCAITEIMPNLGAITNTVYGIGGERGRGQLDEAFQQHFAANGDANEVWNALRDQFRTWLQRHASA